MNRKWYIATIALLLVGVMVFGAIGTGAWLHDTETSRGNTLIVGTLDLQVDGADDPHVASFTFDNLKPCDTVKYEWTLFNTGSIPGQPWIEIVGLKDYENCRSEPEKAVDGTGGCPGLGAGELSSNLFLKINAAGITGYEHPNDPIFCVTPSMKLCSLDFWAGYGRIGKSETWEVIGPYAHTKPMVFEFELPCGVGNEIQSDSVEFDIVIHLDQVGKP